MPLSLILLSSTMSSDVGDVRELLLGILFVPVCSLWHSSLSIFQWLFSGAICFAEPDFPCWDHSPPLFSHLPNKLTESAAGKIQKDHVMTVHRVTLIRYNSDSGWFGRINLSCFITSRTISMDRMVKPFFFFLSPSLFFPPLSFCLVFGVVFFFV